MVPGYYWIEVEAIAKGGVITQTVPSPAIKSGAVRAHSMLLSQTSTSPSGSVADCYISSFNQNGVTQQGKFYAISGTGISEVFCTVTVVNCDARGGFLVELF